MDRAARFAWLTPALARPHALALALAFASACAARRPAPVAHRAARDTHARVVGTSRGEAPARWIRAAAAGRAIVAAQNERGHLLVVAGGQRITMEPHHVRAARGIDEPIEWIGRRGTQWRFVSRHAVFDADAFDGALRRSASGRPFFSRGTGRIVAIRDGSVDAGAMGAGAMPAGSTVVDVAFEDEMRGVALIEPGSALATEDGGRTWRSVSLDREPALGCIATEGARWIVGPETAVRIDADGHATEVPPSRVPVADNEPTEDLEFMALARANDERRLLESALRGSIVDGVVVFIRSRTSLAEYDLITDTLSEPVTTPGDCSLTDVFVADRTYASCRLGRDVILLAREGPSQWRERLRARPSIPHARCFVSADGDVFACDGRCVESAEAGAGHDEPSVCISRAGSTPRTVRVGEGVIVGLDGMDVVRLVGNLAGLDTEIRRGDTHVLDEPLRDAPFVSWAGTQGVPRLDARGSLHGVVYAHCGDATPGRRFPQTNATCSPYDATGLVDVGLDGGARRTNVPPGASQAWNPTGRFAVAVDDQRAWWAIDSLSESSWHRVADEEGVVFEPAVLPASRSRGFDLQPRVEAGCGPAGCLLDANAGFVGWGVPRASRLSAARAWTAEPHAPAPRPTIDCEVAAATMSVQPFAPLIDNSRFARFDAESAAGLSHVQEQPARGRPVGLDVQIDWSRGGIGARVQNAQGIVIPDVANGTTRWTLQWAHEDAAVWRRCALETQLPLGRPCQIVSTVPARRGHALRTVARVEDASTLVVANDHRRAVLVLPSADPITSPHPTWSLHRADIGRVLAWSDRDPAATAEAPATLVAVSGELGNEGFGLYVDARDEIGVARLRNADTLVLRPLDANAAGREVTIASEFCGSDARGEVAIRLRGTLRGNGPTSEGDFVVRLGLGANGACVRRVEASIDDVAHSGWLRAEADVSGLAGISRQMRGVSAVRCRARFRAVSTLTTPSVPR